MSKIAVLIDGGHLRVLAKMAQKPYDGAFIENIGLQCQLAGETIQRILYYDCAPYIGTPLLPISGNKTTFSGSDQCRHANRPRHGELRGEPIG